MKIKKIIFAVLFVLSVSFVPLQSKAYGGGGGGAMPSYIAAKFVIKNENVKTDAEVIKSLIAQLGVAIEGINESKLPNFLKARLLENIMEILRQLANLL